MLKEEKFQIFLKKKHERKRRSALRALKNVAFSAGNWFKYLNFILLPLMCSNHDSQNVFKVILATFCWVSALIGTRASNTGDSTRSAKYIEKKNNTVCIWVINYRSIFCITYVFCNVWGRIDPRSGTWFTEMRSWREDVFQSCEWKCPTNSSKIFEILVRKGLRKKNWKVLCIF